MLACRWTCPGSSMGRGRQTEGPVWLWVSFSSSFSSSAGLTGSYRHERTHQPPRPAARVRRGLVPSSTTLPTVPPHPPHRPARTRRSQDVFSFDRHVLEQRRIGPSPVEHLHPRSLGYELASRRVGRLAGERCGARPAQSGDALSPGRARSTVRREQRLARTRRGALPTGAAVCYSRNPPDGRSQPTTPSGCGAR